MYSIIGIEPESINNWKDLRYVTEKFGFNKGLLIARYPKRWMAMVMEACRNNGVKDLELSRIEEKLRQIKNDRLLKVGLPYTEDGWYESLLKENIDEYFHGVITKEITNPPLCYSVEEVPEDFFENHREIQVERESNSLAFVARNLLSESKIMTLVDPYFQPKNKCIKVLKALIGNLDFNGGGIKKIIIYTAHSIYPISIHALEVKFKELLRGNGGISLEVNRVDDNSIDFDFHARYLLTEKAGLRYDRGFVEPEDYDDRKHKTDVGCLDTTTYEGLISKYCDGAGITLIDSLLIEQE